MQPLRAALVSLWLSGCAPAASPPAAPRPVAPAVDAAQGADAQGRLDAAKAEPERPDAPAASPDLTRGPADAATSDGPPLALDLAPPRDAQPNPVKTDSAAAAPRDGGAWVVCPAAGEVYPPPCRAWQGTPEPFEGTLPRCPFDQPGRDPKPWSAYSCLEYCACWFTGESKCAEFKGIPWGQPHQESSTMAVYADVGSCLGACQQAAPGQLAKWAYEANNNSFHCPKAVPSGLCPFVADEACRKAGSP